MEFLGRLRVLVTHTDGSMEPTLKALRLAREQRGLFEGDPAAEAHLLQRCETFAARDLSPARAIEEEIEYRGFASRVKLSEEAVERILYPGDSDLVRLATEYLTNTYGADQHPAPLDNPLHDVLFRQTTEVCRGLLDDHRAFGSLAADTRRFGSEGHSSLAECMIDLAEQLSYVHSSKPLLFPGTGFVIRGLDPARFLSTLRSGDDPFAEHRAVNPWMSAPIDTIRGCTFVPLRGAFAILPPPDTDDPRFTLDLGSHREPYAYVFYNDHFANPAREKACLVPALVILAKLAKTEIPAWAWEQGLRKSSASIHAKDFTPLGLREACRRYGAPYLDLGTASVFTGGLVNAFPVNSAPYWSWEAYSSGDFRDMHHHKHKSFVTGSYVGFLNAKQEEAFDKFRGGQEDVYQTVKHFRQLLALFKLAKAQWNKGLTLTRAVDRAHEDYRERQDDAAFPADEAPSIMSASELPEMSFEPGNDEPEDDTSLLNGERVNENSFRRLREALRIHEWYHSADAQDRRRYVLRPTNTYRYAAPALQHFALDTVSMTLFTGDGVTFELRGKSREYQQMIWETRVMPLFPRRDVDLRFLEEA